MAAVMIGVDPHKASHTAVAISGSEEQLGTLRVRAGAAQAARMLEWAAAWPERTWAVEGAGGLGHLLAQQLLAAGETVLDVQPKLGARVRLLSAGRSNKTDPNDARAVAIAALRSPGCRAVTADDHAVVLKMWSRRYRELSQARNQIACRLHALLCDLIPGGIAKQITAEYAASILQGTVLADAVQAARRQIAAEYVRDLHHLDLQLRDTKAEITAAVRASGTTLTSIFGVGPVIAAAVLGDTGDITRFPDADHFAAYTGTAPIEVSSGNRKIHRLSRRGNRHLNYMIHMAAVTHIRNKHSQGGAYYDRKITEGKTPKEALRAPKRRISNTIYRALKADARHAARPAETGPGGQPGNDPESSAAGSHPERRLFGQATPRPEPSLRPATATPQARSRARNNHKAT